MTFKQAKKLVKKHYPYAGAAQNHRPGVEGWEVRPIANGAAAPLVWGQLSQEAAWIAAAERIEPK